MFLHFLFISSSVHRWQMHFGQNSLEDAAVHNNLFHNLRLYSDKAIQLRVTPFQIDIWIGTMFVIFGLLLLFFQCFTVPVRATRHKYYFILTFIVTISKLKLFTAGDYSKYDCIPYMHMYSTTLLSPTNGNRIMCLRIITVTGGQDNRGQGSC